jgi:hypothetical protein
LSIDQEGKKVPARPRTGKACQAEGTENAKPRGDQFTDCVQYLPCREQEAVKSP